MANKYVFIDIYLIKGLQAIIKNSLGFYWLREIKYEYKSFLFV